MKKILKMSFIVALFLLFGTLNAKAAWIDYAYVSSPTKFAEEDVKPAFDEDINDVYYINKEGKIFDSEHNEVESLPETLKAKDLKDVFSGYKGCYTT